MKLLTSHFVSSWSLVVDLEAIVLHSDDPLLVRQATTVLDAYKFPVQCNVLLSDGTLVSGMNANDLLDDAALSASDE